MKNWFAIFKTAGMNFLEDRASQLGAALAYYMIFSSTPLLMIAIAIAGAFFGKSTAQQEIIKFIQNGLGQQESEVVKSLLMNAAEPRAGLISATIGLTTLVIGSLTVFTQLKYAMNVVWGVTPKASPGIFYYIRTYVFAFGLVIIIGLLLLLSLIISTVISITQKYFHNYLPGGEELWMFVNLGVSFAILTLLFAMVFKILPDAYLRWRDMWAGALITSALFTLGKYLLGLYFAYGTVGSSFGAAGSLVVLVVWFYWSAQILLFGAEITQAYANTKGAGIHPKSYAERR